MSINKVLISGNLTRDPELRATATGMPVLGLGIAVNDRRKNQSTGEWEDYPNFIDCTLFGSRAEVIVNYLNKGSKVAIEGKLRWSQWERDGQKRSKVEVIIDEIEFLTSRISAVPTTPPIDPDIPLPTPRDPYDGGMDIPF
jgi:single-strand DNA-binding protein